MAIERVVRSYFIVTRCVVRYEVILCCIDNTGLETLIDLAIIHRCSSTTKKLNHLDSNIGRLDPDLQSLHIRNACDWLVCRIEVPRTCLKIAEILHVVLVKYGIKLCPDLSVKHIVLLLSACEDEWEGVYAEIINGSLKSRGVDPCKIKCSSLNLIDCLILGTKLCIEVNLNLYASVRLLLYELCKFLHTLRNGVVCWLILSKLECYYAGILLVSASEHCR